MISTNVYPDAIEPDRVGSYPALSKSGDGNVK